MSRFFITLAWIAFAGVCSAKNLEQHVQLVEDIDQFRAENPEVVLTPMIVESIQPFAENLYSFGRRVRGDQVVAKSSEVFNCPVQDVRINLKYPEGGVGQVVSHVKIVVDQSSKAYIVSGGVGQRHISIVLEAKDTCNFYYRAVIYGY